MADATLALTTRQASGSTAARALRRAGRVPATLFGHGGAPVSVSADARELGELLRTGGGRHLVRVTLDGAADDTALVRSVARDPISRGLVHVDLQRVNAEESITATINVTLTGVARGVKEQGGQLDFVGHTIEISGPANRLPDGLSHDISELALSEHVSAAQIALPAGFTLVTLPETVIVAIEIPRAELEPTVPAEAAAAAS